jgi:hypothetical protein
MKCQFFDWHARLRPGNDFNGQADDTEEARDDHRFFRTYLKNRCRSRLAPNSLFGDVLSGVQNALSGFPASLIEHRGGLARQTAGGLAAEDVPARRSAAFRHAGVRE